MTAEIEWRSFVELNRETKKYCIILMILKCIFDRVVALLGLLFLWPVLVVVAIMVKVKMPGGPAFFLCKIGRAHV